VADRGRLVELRREVEWRRCSGNPEYFLGTYWKIRHPSQGLVPFKLREAQQAGLQHWLDNRYSLTLKARQIGWSTLATGFQVWWALFKPESEVIDVSRTEREAKDLLAKSMRGYRNLPEWMRKRVRTVSDTQTEVVFSNGSKIASHPSASDPARGTSASLIIVDEWAFLPNPEEAWASIEPVADIGGRIIGLSTANGWGNFFHTLWSEAKQGSNQFETLFFGWDAVPERDQAWWLAKKASLPAWQLAQEYPSNEREAFIQSGRNVIEQEVIDRIGPQEPVAVGSLRDTDVAGGGAWTLAPDPNGPLRVWAFPEPDGVYVLGADVAEGLEHGDFSSAHVISADTGEVVAHWHGHLAPDLFATEIYRLGRWFNDALVAPEANNHGLTVVTELRSLRYPRMFRNRSLGTIRREPQERFGWFTSSVTKPILVDEMVANLRDGSLQLFCERTKAELETFTRDAKGRMRGSPHDDRVISLGIANQMLKYAFSRPYHQEVDKQWTLDWWASLPRAGEQEHDEGWVIGRHSVAGRR
jgi:hypothetical protein